MKISEFKRIGPGKGVPNFNGRSFDPGTGVLVDSAGNTYGLRPQSARVLQHLIAHVGDVVSKGDLFDAVWPDTAVTDDSLTQCISEIRRALGDADRCVLETIPRQGFCLHPDGDAPRGVPLALKAVIACGFAVLIVGGTVWREGVADHEVPTVSIEAGPGAELLATEAGAALDRFGSVRRLSQGARFVLTLTRPSDGRLSAELTDSETASVVLARSIPANEALDRSGARLAVQVASPWSGAIAGTMIETAFEKPLETLTPFECYLHAFRQESEAMLRRAEACLDQLITKDPANARAHALLGDVYATEYWYGIGLDGPERNDRRQRDPLAAKALATVQAAEAAGLPDEAEIHLSIAISYYANCKLNHMTAALDRAMALNPNDPWIFGLAGNYLAYSGDWETGVPLARQAIAMAGEDAERWWHWAIGKDYWQRGEDAAALKSFMRGYMEGDWHTQLHLAYTLPGLGRTKEAAKEVKRLREIYPGFTRDDARESHRRWCFEADFIAEMDEALEQAGLPDGPEISNARQDVAAFGLQEQ